MVNYRNVKVAKKKKSINKLTNKCENEKIARFLYDDENYGNIQWIPFNEFEDIEYLARGGFNEVYKATWFDYDKKVVLKKIKNLCEKIIKILKNEKKKRFNNDIDICYCYSFCNKY